MKFGVREICDVVLKSKAAQKIGNKVFYKNEPVLYFDSLKTSSMEGAATTVYAQGGRGNARLIAWEGERTVTFTMEDALISAEGFSILTGAGLIDGNEKSIIMHQTEQTDRVKITKNNDNKIIKVEIALSELPYLGQVNVTPDSNHKYTYTADNKEDYIYVMLMKDGEIVSEPFIPSEVTVQQASGAEDFTGETTSYESEDLYIVSLYAEEDSKEYSDSVPGSNGSTLYRQNDLKDFEDNSVVLVDYYVERKGGAFQVDITPDKFGGNFYLEASTLFRSTNGVDLPAEFIIPNCKIQSNFTFTMASSGDPSTFTFTMDAFPDYTRWDKTKKVYAAIQVLNLDEINTSLERLGTVHNNNGVKTRYNKEQRNAIEGSHAFYYAEPVTTPGGGGTS